MTVRVNYLFLFIRIFFAFMSFCKLKYFTLLFVTLAFDHVTKSDTVPEWIRKINRRGQSKFKKFLACTSNKSLLTT